MEVGMEIGTDTGKGRTMTRDIRAQNSHVAEEIC
jgi:hypothetical protein